MYKENRNNDFIQQFVSSASPWRHFGEYDTEQHTLFMYSMWYLWWPDSAQHNAIKKANISSQHNDIKPQHNDIKPQHNDIKPQHNNIKPQHNENAPDH